jgi:hypothetical protein
VADATVQVTGTVLHRRPDEFVQTLNPTDLILIARRRSNLLQFLFGNVMDRLIEFALGPVAVLAMNSCTRDARSWGSS